MDDHAYLKSSGDVMGRQVAMQRFEQIDNTMKELINLIRPSTMPAKSIGTVQSSFLLNVSPPPITMLDCDWKMTTNVCKCANFVTNV